MGAFVSTASGTSIKLTGFEVRYAILKDGIIKPAVSLRVTYSELDGVDELDLDSRGVELTISKGLGFVTPYGGIGRVETDSKPDPTTGLADEEIKQTKTYVGVNLNSGLMNFAFELDKTGDAETLSAKLGWRF